MMSEPAQANALEEQITQLETAVDRARARSDPRFLIDALIQLGQAHLDSGNVPKALTQYEEALELAQELKEELLEARLWGYKGICLVRLGNFHFAQIALYKSHNMAKALNHAPLLIDALTQLGNLQLEMGQGARAISRLEQAYGIALSTGDRLRAMNLAGKIGALFSNMESSEKALEYFASAQQLARELGQPQAECAYLLQMGNVLLANREGDGAIELFESALNLAAELANPQAEMSALSSLMRAYMAEDKLSMVALYGEQVVHLARERGEAGLEIANINLLAAYLVEKGQARRALPHLQRGLEIAESSDDWPWQLTMLNQLGYAYYDLQALDAALNAYEGALKRTRQLQDKAASGQVYGRLSAVLAENGQLSEAITAAQQALALGQELGDALLIGEQQIMLAFTYNDLGDAEQAQAYCRQAVETYRGLGEAALLEKAETFLQSLAG